MKNNIKKIILKLASTAAALAMICAVTNAGSTCLFLTYQPDVPEELLN